MEHGTLPVMEYGKIIGNGYIIRDYDFPGDDVLCVNDDYVVPVNLTDVVHVINWTDPNEPPDYWRIEHKGTGHCPYHGPYELDAEDGNCPTCVAIGADYCAGAGKSYKNW